MGTTPPEYRATAMVLIEDTVGQHPLLAELQIPTGNTEAATAIALIKTRSVTEQVVKSVSDGAVPSPEHPEYARHMGLTTQVDDESHLAAHEWLDRLTGERRGEFRLFATIDERSPEAPDTIRVRFREDGKLVISTPGGVAGFDWGDEARKVVDWSPNEPLEYRGIVFRIAPQGDVDDRSFLVKHLEPRAAAEKVLENLVVSETGKNTGVVRVIVDDSDPFRAAEIANAIARNYLDIALGRSERQADTTREFIEEELDRRQQELTEVEREVERLQTLYPEAYDVSVATSTMIQHKYAFDEEAYRVSIRRRTYEDAVNALEDGDYEAFSRIGQEIDDPVTKGYLSEIGALYSAYQRTFRGDMGTHHQVLQERFAAISDRAEELDLRIHALEDVLDKLRAGETEVLSRFFQEFEPDNPKLLTDGQTNALLENIAKMKADLAGMETLQTEEHEDVRYLRVTIPKLEKQVFDHLVKRLEGMKVQREDLAPLVRDRTAKLTQFPVSERAEIDKALGGLREVTARAIRHRMEALGQQEASLNAFVEDLAAQLVAMPEKERLLAEPLRRRRSLTDTVNFLMQKRSESVVSAAGTLSVADLIDLAFRPRARTSPRVLFSLLVGGAFGFLLGLGLATLRERLDGGIHSEAQLELATGLPVLVGVPQLRGSEARGELLADDPEGLAAEAYRVLRSKVQGSGERIRTLAVTSAMPGEGKTATNAGLAMAYALGGHRVLLVDADLRSPKLHRFFELDAKPGLAECLDGRKHWAQCTRPSGYANLDVLAAGDHYYAPSDMLSGGSTDRFLAELQDAYDIVVFDVPQTWNCPDVEALAGKLDAVVYLYRDSAGPRHEVAARTIVSLRRSGANLIGVVHNGLTGPRARRSSFAHLMKKAA